MITLPDPLDIQVATGWPAVAAWRAALSSLRAQRVAVARSAAHREFALANYITTTEAGRTGRAGAIEGHERAKRELAEMEAALPELQAAAERENPAAAARVLLSIRAYSNRLQREHDRRVAEV